MTKGEFYKLIKKVINSPRSDSQKITMIQSGFAEYIEDNDNDKWIPCSKELPEEEKAVQVTYIGYHDKLPYCDDFAYLEDGKWYWKDDDGEVGVEIVAWKPIDEPYKEGE